MTHFPSKTAFLVLGTCFAGLSLPAFAVGGTPLPSLSPKTAIIQKQPYGDPAKAAQAGHAAFEEAIKENKLVLMNFGANFSTDCRVLAGLLQTPEISPWIQQHFAVVYINVDHLNNDNMRKARHWGVEVTALPTLLALTPSGTLLNKEDVLALSHAQNMPPQEIINLLEKWIRRGVEAKKIEKAKGLERTKKCAGKPAQPHRPKYYENGDIKFGVNLNHLQQ